MNFYRRVSALLKIAVALWASSLIAPPATACAATPRASAISKLVIDARSGREIYAVNASQRRSPASLAKLMTLLLAFEAMDKGTLRGSDRLTMTARGSRQPPSRLGLARGGKIQVQAALRTIAVISANDVAVALAERLGRTEAGFVRLMKRRAAQIGMTSTRFGNATGLSPGAGLTTARDMAALSRYIIRRHPSRYRLFATRSIRWNGWVRGNHNRLLGRVAGLDGLKTGYTARAGFNLAASARRKGRRIIVVVMGAKAAAARDVLVANLLEVGFSSPASARAN